MHKLLLLLAVLIFPVKLFCFDMENYLEKNKQQSEAKLLNNFPYSEHLESVGINDFPTIQKHRFLISENFSSENSGDGFLYHLAQAHLDAATINTDSERIKIISVGEEYLDFRKELSNSYQPNLKRDIQYKKAVNQAYVTIGYFFLSEVADRIHTSFLKGDFDRNNSENKAILKRLENNKVFVSFEETQANKLIQNVKKGRFTYIWSRFTTRIEAFTCGKYRFVFWGIVLALLIPIFLKTGRWFKSLCVAGLLLAFSIKISTPCDLVENADDKTPSAFYEENISHLYPDNSGNSSVEISAIKKSVSTLDYAIRMKRPEIKSTYFAQSPVEEFEEFRKQNRIVCAATGGYATYIGDGRLRPDGFTVQSGEIINPIILHDRHGLLLFTEGGIRMLNLSTAEVVLPNGERIDNPLKSILAYSKLMNWCTDNKATVFQTHLLAFGGSLLIDPAKAKSDKKERRLLAIVRDLSSAELSHVIIDIPAKYELASLSSEIFRLLSDDGHKVEGMVNLDTGAFNILSVFDENDQLLRTPSGLIGLENAINLVVYYQ